MPRVEAGSMPSSKWFSQDLSSRRRASPREQRGQAWRAARAENASFGHRKGRRIPYTPLASSAASVVKDTTSEISASSLADPMPVAQDPPGPDAFPLVGCLPRLLRNPMDFFTDVARTYGGIARIPVGRETVYLISDPKLLYELLVTNRIKYRKNTRYRHAQALIGEGMLLSEDDTWKRQRLITQPAFKPASNAEQIDWMAELTSRFLNDWEAFVDNGESIDVEPEFNRLAQLLAGRLAFGKRFEEIADEFCEISVRIKSHWPKPPRNLISLWIRPGANAKFERFKSVLSELDNLVSRYISHERLSDFENSGILSLLVKSSRQEGQEFSEKELRDQLLTLFFAGHETSATAMCWIHYFLSKYSHIRSKVRDEVGRELGSDTPTFANLEKLAYTGQVVHEALRIYSPIHSISRVALEDNQIGGYTIPAGSTIYVSLYATHRLEQYWPNPEVFDPERFTSEQCENRPRFAYIPFAAGHRNCIGGTLAVLELKMLTAQVAQRYVLDLVPGHRVVPAAGTTMYPRYGMKMTIRRI